MFSRRGIMWIYCICSVNATGICMSLQPRACHSMPHYSRTRTGMPKQLWRTENRDSKQLVPSQSETAHLNERGFLMKSFVLFLRKYLKILRSSLSMYITFIHLFLDKCLTLDWSKDEKYWILWKQIWPYVQLLFWWNKLGNKSKMRHCRCCKSHASFCGFCNMLCFHNAEWTCISDSKWSL